MKAIEPGCLCLVVCPFSTSQTVTALRRVGGEKVKVANNGESMMVTAGDQTWEISKPVHYSDSSGNTLDAACMSEEYLLRIDGNPDTVEREEKERVCS